MTVNIAFYFVLTCFALVRCGHLMVETIRAHSLWAILYAIVTILLLASAFYDLHGSFTH